MRRSADHDARLDALECRVAALEAQARRQICRPSRDAADGHLRQVLAVSTKGLPFTASALLGHAAEVTELRLALEAATLQSRDEIGAWLRDRQGTADGITIQRLRRRRWRAYTSDTSDTFKGLD